jgi:hypothetical protein
MFCSSCGTAVDPNSKFCGSCGQALNTPTGAALAESVRPRVEAAIRAPKGLLAIVGLALGAFIGFLMRPSVFLVGQLPLGTVIARGSNLNGLDTVLVPTAQTSFNMVLAGGVIGAVGGVLVSRLMSRDRS